MKSTNRHALSALFIAGVLAACASGIAPDETDDGSDTTATTGGGGQPATSGQTSSGPGPSSTAATSGGGGDPTSGAGGGSAASSTAMSSSSGGNTCAHSVCVSGPALMQNCGDPCVNTVCTQDPFCCSVSWDSLCIETANLLCSAMCAIPMNPGDLVITEIMNNPSAVADSAGEWFEVYNDSFNAVDLQGLVIRHQLNDPNAVDTITQSVVVQPGSYAVLGINSNTSTNGNVTVDYQYASSVNLNNTSDYLALEDANAMIIDEVTYSETSGLDPNGKTRNLDPLYQTAWDNDDDMNFCEATTVIPGGTDMGSPGQFNDACP